MASGWRRPGASAPVTRRRSGCSRPKRVNAGVSASPTDLQVGDVGLSFSPDGRFLALLRFATRSVGDVYLLPLDAGYTARGPLVRLTYENLAGRWPLPGSPGNRIVYSSGGALGYRTLRMLAIDPAHPERRVEPVPLPAGEQATMLAVGARPPRLRARATRHEHLAPAASGLRAPAAGTHAADRFDVRRPQSGLFRRRDARSRSRPRARAPRRSGSRTPTVRQATQMTSIGGPNTSNSRWSRDGRTILFNSRRSGSSDLYRPGCGHSLRPAPDRRPERRVRAEVVAGRELDLLRLDAQRAPRSLEDPFRRPVRPSR